MHPVLEMNRILGSIQKKYDYPFWGNSSGSQRERGRGRGRGRGLGYRRGRQSFNEEPLN